MSTTAQTERPRRNREATRRRLLEAARELFAEHGYDNVGVRMIAAAADANVALVNRYFGSKAELFAELLTGESPSPLSRVIDGDPAGLPRRLAEHIVRRLQTEPAPMLRALDRSMGSKEVQPILQRHVERVLIGPIADRLPGPDARARATLAASIIFGFGSVRRTLGLEDLQSADPAALTDRLTTMFTAALS